jgi:hypothetical protein
MKERPEVEQQSVLGNVTDRLTARVRASAQSQPHGREHSGEVVHGHATDEAALDPAALGGRKPDRSAESSQGESAVDPGIADLATERDTDVASPNRARVDRADPWRHAARMMVTGCVGMADRSPANRRAG